MAAKRRLVENSIMGWILVMLVLFLSLKWYMVKGRTMTFPEPEHGYAGDQYLHADGAGSIYGKSDKPVYLGYELALGRSICTLINTLTKRNNLHVNNLGAIAGAANKYGKHKGNAGLYYSDASPPHSFDLFTAGVSAYVYVLRIGNAKYHTIEPYFTGRITQHIKFYGNYLDQNSAHNYSTSEEQFLGKEVVTQFNVGLNAEYQLENDRVDFIHLFTEVTCGVPLATRCTRKIFNHTHITNPITISIGLSFEKIKERSL